LDFLLLRVCLRFPPNALGEEGGDMWLYFSLKVTGLSERKANLASSNWDGVLATFLDSPVVPYLRLKFVVLFF
jgi:hypothetical protein